MAVVMAVVKVEAARVEVEATAVARVAVWARAAGARAVSEDLEGCSAEAD